MDRRSFVAGAALASGMWSGSARAAGSLLKIIYPYASGSGGDTLVRWLVDDLARQFDLKGIVENKTGADGRIGVQQVKTSSPDGETLLFTPFGTMVLFPTVFKDLPYDPVRDFAPVTQVATFDFGLAAGPMSKAKTLPELVDWLKKNPDQGSVGVPGLGALPHLLPLEFARQSSTRVQAVQYRGAAPAVTDAIAGHVPLVCAPLADLIGQAKAGGLQLLAVSGRARSPFMPDIPTFKEYGYDIVGSGWYAIYAPAQTPPAMLEKLNKGLIGAIKSESFQARARSVWLSPTGTSPSELAAIQKEDFERWAPIAKRIIDSAAR